MVDRCRIAIVDNYPIFRDGVVQTLLRPKKFSVVAEGATSEEAEQFVSEMGLDVILIEAAVAGSLKTAQAILRSHKNVKVIFLASAEDQEHATQALHAGVHGYIMKGITGLELIKAINAVQRGERYITPDLAWRLVTKPDSSPVHSRQHLSIREQQVLDHASKGLTNQEIARILGLAVSTIKYYKTLAFKKMGVRNRLEALLQLTRWQS